MEFEFMSADTVLPPCMPLPAAMLRLPISSTAKVMYARLLNTTLTAGIEDSNGILFVRFPIMELAAALSRSPVTVNRVYIFCLQRIFSFPRPWKYIIRASCRKTVISH